MQKMCPSCGEEVELHHNMCPLCGEEFHTKEKLYSLSEFEEDEWTETDWGEQFERVK